MAAESKIEWTDSTFSPWSGCTKVSPACDHCYAEALSKRAPKTIGQWGAGQPRRRTSAAYWKQPLRWNAREFRECVCGHRGESGEWAIADPFGCPACGSHDHRPARRRVFCASLADWLDNEVPIEWLVDLLDLIRRTPELDWLLLTKRVGNWRSRLQSALSFAERMPGLNGDLCDWIEFWLGGGAVPRNVSLGATICNQAEADRDIPKLLATPAAKRFLSIEPMLGPVDLPHGATLDGDADDSIPGIDWVICGGESGPHARPMHPDWVRSLRDQCAAAGAPFLFKQWGEWRPSADGEGFNTAYGMSGKPPALLVSPDGNVHCFYPQDDTAVSEVLAGGGDRHRKFDLDELERYIATYRDFTPILYLVAKFLPDAGTAQAAAIEQLAAFTAQFPQIVAQLGLGKRK